MMISHFSSDCTSAIHHLYVYVHYDKICLSFRIKAMVGHSYLYISCNCFVLRYLKVLNFFLSRKMRDERMEYIFYILSAIHERESFRNAEMNFNEYYII